MGLSKQRTEIGYRDARKDTETFKYNKKDTTFTMQAEGGRDFSQIEQTRLLTEILK